jgi:hypothetical protein
MVIEGDGFVMGIGESSCGFVKDGIGHWGGSKGPVEDVSSIFSRPHLSDLYDEPI